MSADLSVSCNNDFFSKTTGPRDMLFFLNDSLSIDYDKLFKAFRSICPSVCYNRKCENFYPIFTPFSLMESQGCSILTIVDYCILGEP